jgi:hypothetical protein
LKTVSFEKHVGDKKGLTAPFAVDVKRREVICEPGTGDMLPNKHLNSDTLFVGAF